MKKTLLAISLLAYSSVAHAGLINLTDYISNNDVTIENLASDNTTTENVINGNVAGGGVNILPGSITSIDMATSISPVTRWNEAFNDFTVSGMLPVTDSDLTSDISAGVSYVNGLRIENTAQSHTYTASKDTYVYICETGSYDFNEVANGASAPSTDANCLLLAKAVTSGTQITSVSDLRTTSIQITATTSNFPSDFRNQAYMSWDSTTASHIEPGNFSVGTTIYTKTSDTSSKTITTGTNWIEGSAPNLSVAAGQLFYAYGYNDAGSTWDYKYASADPAYSDGSSNTGGTLRYYTTGGTTYRALGWLYATSDTVQQWHIANYPDFGTENTVYRERNDTGSLSVTTPAYDTSKPQNTEGVEIFTVAFKPSNAQAKIHIEGEIMGTHGNATAQLILSLFQDSMADSLKTWTRRVEGPTSIETLYFSTTLRASTTSLRTYKVRVGSATSGVFYFNRDDTSAKYNGNAYSWIRITEVQG